MPLFPSDYLPSAPHHPSAAVMLAACGRRSGITP
jgi:hypothetical protein